MNNLIRRKEGEAQTIFVRCARCHELVAVYQLQDYYHHGKGYESWVGSRRPSESARDLRELFERAQDEALVGFAEVLEELAKQGKSI